MATMLSFVIAVLATMIGGLLTLIRSRGLLRHERQDIVMMA